MPSIIEVDTIKNKTGTQNTVLSTDGSGNNTLNANTIKNGSATKTLAEYSSSAWTWGSGVPAGSVLQVLNTTKTDKEQITGGSASTDTAFKLVSATGGSGVFQQAITVTGSNKVLINVTANLAHFVNNYTTFLAIFRGAAVDTAIGSCTKIGVGTGQGSSQNTASFSGQSHDDIANTASNGSLMFEDTPGAGTHYYKVGVYIEYNASTNYGFINAAKNDGNQAYKAIYVSSLTLMEVKA